MSDIYTLSQPLSADIQTTLEKVNRICTVAGCEFFIAGATAREVLLTHVHGRKTGRHTRDIDIAVFIDTWEQFTALKASMLAGGAAEVKGNAHRLLWDDIELDIIPFGGIADGNEVAWPPDRDIIMSVDGFTEAWTHAVSVDIPQCGVVRFCSLPGLLLLKLFAWRDRGDRSNKDAVDIYKILCEYAVIEDARLYDNAEWGDRVDWEPERLGALLAGHDVVAMAMPESRESLQKLDPDALVDAIVRQPGAGHADDIENRINDFWYTLVQE